MSGGKKPGGPNGSPKVSQDTSVNKNKAQKGNEANTSSADTKANKANNDKQERASEVIGQAAVDTANLDNTSNSNTKPEPTPESDSKFNKDLDAGETADFLKSLEDDSGPIKVSAYEVDNTNRNELEAKKEFERRKLLYENRGIFGIIADKIKRKSSTPESDSNTPIKRGLFKAIANTFKYEFFLTKHTTKEKIAKEIRNTRQEAGITEDHKQYAKNLEKAKELGLDNGASEVKRGSVGDTLKKIILDSIAEMNTGNKTLEEKQKIFDKTKDALAEYKKMAKDGDEDRLNANIVQDIDTTSVENFVEKIAQREHNLSMEAVKKYFDEKVVAESFSFSDGYNTEVKKRLTEKLSGKIALLTGSAVAGGAVYASTNYALKFVRQPIRAALAVTLGATVGGAIFGAFRGYQSAKERISDTSFNSEIGIKNSDKNAKLNVDSKKISDIITQINRPPYKKGDKFVDADGKERILADKAEIKSLNHALTKKRNEAIVDLKSRWMSGMKHKAAFLAYDGIESVTAQKAEILDTIISYESKLSKKSLAKYNTAVEKAMAVHELKFKEVKKARRSYVAKTVALRAVIAGGAAAAGAQVVKAIRENLSPKNSNLSDELANSRGGGHQSDKAESIKKLKEDLQKETQERLINSEKPTETVVDKDTFFDKVGGRVKISRRSWDKTPSAFIGNWKKVGNGKDAYYELSVKGLKGNKNIDDCEYLISSNGKTISLDIDDGKVRVPVGSSIGKTFFGQGRNGVDFKGTYGEVARNMGDGKMHVMSTVAGSSSIKKFKLFEGVDSPRPVNLSNEIDNFYGNTDSKLIDEGDITLGNGTKLDVWNVSNGPNPEQNPFFMDKIGNNTYGPMLYEPGMSAESAAEKVIKNIPNSSENLAWWARALNADRSSKNLGDLNYTANVLLRGGDEQAYSDYVSNVNDTLKSLISGGSVKFIDLNRTGYTRSFYQYLSGEDIVLGTSNIRPGAGGMAIELLDKDGKNIFSGESLRYLKTMLGVSPSEKGRIVIRLDCGGQPVWVKEGRDNITLKIIEKTRKIEDVVDEEEVIEEEITENININTDDDTIINNTIINNNIDNSTDQTNITNITNIINNEPNTPNVPNLPNAPTEELTPKVAEEIIQNQTPQDGSIIEQTLTEDLETVSPLTESPEAAVIDNVDFGHGSTTIPDLGNAEEDAFGVITDNAGSGLLDENNPADVIAETVSGSSGGGFSAPTSFVEEDEEELLGE